MSLVVLWHAFEEVGSSGSASHSYLGGSRFKYRLWYEVARYFDLRRPLISSGPYFGKWIKKKIFFQSNTFHSLPLVLRGKWVWDFWRVKNNKVTQIYFAPWLPVGVGIAQSLSRLATGCIIRGSNPGGGEIFCTCPDGLWGPLSLLYNGYQVFPGGKAAGAWRWPPTPSSAEVKERVDLYLYSPSWPSWPILGWNLPLPLAYCD